MFLDPYREYYKPDIFTFGGDKVRMDFNIAGQSVNKKNMPSIVSQKPRSEEFLTCTESRSSRTGTDRRTWRPSVDITPARPGKPTETVSSLP